MQIHRTKLAKQGRHVSCGSQYRQARHGSGTQGSAADPWGILRSAGNHVVCNFGPRPRDDRATMNGTLLVAEVDGIEQIRIFVAEDPYSRAGLFQSVEIRHGDCGLSTLPATG